MRAEGGARATRCHLAVRPSLPCATGGTSTEMALAAEHAHAACSPQNRCLTSVRYGNVLAIRADLIIYEDAFLIHCSRRMWTSSCSRGPREGELDPPRA